MSQPSLLKLINFWPPFLGAGIRVRKMSKDMREIEVEMKLSPLNRNYVGTHFGGSLYAMTDPFYMLMLISNLGKNYLVWDKSAAIRFKKPGRGKVTAKFQLSEKQIEDIRKKADTEKKCEPTFTVLIHNEAGEIVAEVDKLLWVKRKDKSIQTPRAKS